MTGIKERPILFSAPMVRAILEGRKTMTRRTRGLDKINDDPEAWALVANKGGGKWMFRRKDSCTFATATCPYGNPGDRLWVRETWMPIFVNPLPGYDIDKTQYRADETNPRAGKGMWRPSIHMPRQRSRITLEITNVRVERLQDITEDDAVAEGVEIIPADGVSYVDYTGVYVCKECAVFSFFSLWEKINGRASLDSNPWVWVVKFRRIMP